MDDQYLKPNDIENVTMLNIMRFLILTILYYVYNSMILNRLYPRKVINLYTALCSCSNANACIILLGILQTTYYTLRERYWKVELKNNNHISSNLPQKWKKPKNLILKLSGPIRRQFYEKFLDMAGRTNQSKDSSAIKELQPHCAL